MPPRPFFACLLPLLLAACAWSEPPSESPLRPPNILLILADDLGYGDPGCYNPDSRIPTPHLDRLAADGLRFTDAHATSAVCTPTRYGIVTGQYSWRGPLKRGVTWSYDTLIIDTTRSTVASLLKDQGYRTACVGKWHLGLGWQKQDGQPRFDRPLTAGPVNLGFDDFYGITASLDIPPYVYLRNREVVRQPTDSTQGTAEGYYDDYWRPGPVSPDFDHFESLNHLTSVAERTIRAGAATGGPFFLYFPLTAPHLPWIPRDTFRGKSGVAAYGDLTVEVDDVIGRLMRLLDELGISDNTLVLFTSDNGSQLSSELMAEHRHRANGPWRGRKGDVYEGGHRVPFIARWPARIPAGGTTDALVSTTDFYATFADLFDLPAQPVGEVKDSHSFLPVLLGDPDASPREAMIYHSSAGMFALREGDRVLIRGRGAGGFMEQRDTSLADPPRQLYDLAADPGQTENLATARPEEVARLEKRLRDLIHR